MLTAALVLGSSAVLADDGYPGYDPSLHWPQDMVTSAGSAFGSLAGAGSVGATGQYEYQIPIDVPPGRLGMQPRLALVYSSGSSNDLLGVGWTLSGLSSVAPCLKRHATDQDAYFGALCWDGKRLVAVPDTMPQQYRTEEESYARIIQDGTGFTIDTKDGHHQVFRRQFGPTLLASALLVEESDQRDNAVRYTYEVVSAGEYYPESITYTHRGDEPGQRTIAFDYTKQLRDDPITVYSEGARYDTKRLLSTITASAPNPVTPAAVWQYKLAYTTSATSKRSLLKSVVRLDQLGGRTLQKKFNWSSSAGPGYEPVGENYNWGDFPDINSSDLKDGYLVADFDQDGKDDLIYHIGAQAPILRGFQPQNPLGVERELQGLTYKDGDSTYYPDLSQARVGDVNGDGYLDIVAPTVVDLDAAAYVVYLWDWAAEDFKQDAIVEEYRNGADPPMPLFLADMDGDGLPDIVKGYSPTVNPEPSDQQWAWFNWGVRLNDHHGSFAAVQGSINGHAFGGNSPPYFGYSANVSTGRNTLFAMSTKVQSCSSSTHESGCHWVPGLPCSSDFEPTEDCGDDTWVCDGPTVSNFSTHQSGSDFGITLSESLTPTVVDFSKASEPHSLRSLADLNGDGIDDVVTFHADTNKLCIRAWGSGKDLLWLEEPRCVTVDTGRDPEPAVYVDDSGATDHCGYVTMTTPAPWRLRVWDVDGDGRHDVVIQHLDESAGFQTDGEVHRAFLDATGTLQAEPFPQIGGGPYTDIGSVIGDFDGDGRTDLLAFGTTHIAKVVIQKSATTDYITGVIDENAASEMERVEYSTTWWPASSTWEKNWPRFQGPGAFGGDYKHDSIFTGGYPVKMVRRGFNVARKHDIYQGDDIGEYIHHEYTYADPTFDLRGRGFLGFRVVDHYLPDQPTEEVTFYSNFANDYDPQTNKGGVYPGAMRAVERFQLTPVLDSADEYCIHCTTRVVHWQGGYERVPGTTGRSYAIRPENWMLVEWEQMLDSLGSFGNVPHFFDGDAGAPTYEHATGPVKFRTGFTLYDSYGNALQETSSNPAGQSRTVSTSYYPPDLAAWRLGLVESEEITVVNANVGNVTPRRVDYEYTDGLRSKVLIEKGFADPTIPSVTTLGRNADGSIISVTNSAANVADRTVLLAYEDPERMFVTRMTNALGQSTRQLTHPAYGVVVAALDLNQLLTKWQINDRGMITSVSPAGSPTVSVSYSDRNSNGVVVVQSSNVDAAHAVAEYDLRGRRILSGRTGFDGTMIFAKSVYDQLGREVAWSLPGLGLPSNSYGSRKFDTLGRITTIHPPGGFDTTYEHTLLTTETTFGGNATTPASKTKVTVDTDGRRVASAQFDAETNQWLETKYLYGAFDQVQAIVDPEGNTITFTYDQLGRKTSTTRPDAGTSSSKYDGLGNLTQTTRPGSITYYTKRDLLGRLEEQEDADGVTSFTWDTAPNGIGKLARSVSPDPVIHDLTYDGYGRPQAETWTVAGEAFTFTNDYDVHGRLSARHYPSAGATQVTVANHYQFGYLASVDGIDPISQTSVTWWRTNSVDPGGGITSGQFGNGVTAERSYDPATGRLDWMKDVGVLEQTFDYDVRGRIKSQEDGAGRREELTYDSLRRLKTWTLQAKQTSAVTTYDYDHLGNLISEERESGGTVEKTTHSQGASVFGPHTPGGDSLFDGRGRLKNPNGQTTHYTEFDLPRQIGGETFFEYDAEHTRVRKTGPAGTVVTIAGLFERRVDQQGTAHVYMVPGPEGVVAQITLDAGMPNGGHVDYLHSARKGSVAVTSNAAGVAQPAMYYDPFGVRTDDGGEPGGVISADITLGYKGLDHDDELGLINQRGRMYNASTRRFLTPDPMVSEPLDGQSYNPYSYVRNDPINRTDPSGFCDVYPCFDGQLQPLPDTGFSAYFSWTTGLSIVTTERTHATPTTTKQAAPSPPVQIGINGPTATPSGPTADVTPPGLNEWRRMERILSYDEPPSLGLGTDYALRYELKKHFRPIFSWLSDERPTYLDADHNVQTSSVSQDHTDAVPLIGEIAAMFLPVPKVGLAGGVAEGGAIRVASGEGVSAPATLVREIRRGESVASIVQEAAQLTYESGGLEHAVISTQSGQRLLLQGGPKGMSFEGFALRRVLGHTHPFPTGPSGADFFMLQQTGQRSSWIYELFGGGLTRFRSP